MNKQIGYPFTYQLDGTESINALGEIFIPLYNTPNRHHKFHFYGVVTGTELISTGGLRKELVQGSGFECEFSDKSIRIATHANIAEHLFKNSLRHNF
jgi:hypothetical protein